MILKTFDRSIQASGVKIKSPPLAWQQVGFLSNNLQGVFASRRLTT
jgi:hypothetical protein